MSTADGVARSTFHNSPYVAVLQVLIRVSTKSAWHYTVKLLSHVRSDRIRRALTTLNLRHHHWHFCINSTYEVAMARHFHNFDKPIS